MFEKTNRSAASRIWSIWRRRLHRTAFDWPHKAHHLSNEVTAKLESHWRELVLKSERDSKSATKKYVLSMFPYPSGNLHMGHVRVYAISDTLARYYSLLGYETIHPMGWDAFGLPAENAAIERNQSPEKWTLANIEIMREQLLKLGCRFDWDMEIATCDPSFYRWTQLIFVKLFEAGLAYQRESYVNWDPVDRTVLAQEQIDENGRSWRSGAVVEKKLLRQWFVRATRFTKDLSDELSNLSHWDDIVDIQRNWLGECDAYKFWFPLEKSDGARHNDEIDLLVKDPSRLAKAVFLAIRPAHILNQDKYVADAVGDEKVLSLFAVNRLTGRRLPIMVSNAVEYEHELSDVHVGTLNNETDRKLLQRFRSTLGSLPEEESVPAETVLVTAKANNWGGYLTSRKLGDWVVSRQRYWGTPIPIVHCPKCKAVPVPESQLPVQLPKQFPSSDLKSVNHRSPLAAVQDWVNTTCPKCGGRAERETDTLDTFFDSSWYYLRYLDAKNPNQPFARSKAEKFMPVDIYVGGKEHATLHLYYARVISHFLYSLGWNPTREPFHQLLPQGMIMGKAYQIESTGQYIPMERVKFEKNRMFDSVSGHPVTELWEKMSKSKHNGVNPSDILETYGTDMTRLLVMSTAAPRSHRNWDLTAVKGLRNWLDRIKFLVSSYVEERGKASSESDSRSPPVAIIESKQYKENEEQLKEQYNRVIRKTTHYVGDVQQLNTAITMLTSFTSALRKSPSAVSPWSIEFERCLHALIVMLSIFAPHFAAESWSAMARVPPLAKLNSSWRKDRDVWQQEWPQFDKDALFDLEIFVSDDKQGQIALDRNLLRTLSATQAFELVKTNKVGMEMTLGYEWIEPKSIKYTENYGAKLILHGKKKKKRNQQHKTATTREM